MIVCSGADQRKHQSSASLAFVWGIHRWPMNSQHKGPVTRKMFPLDDVIMGRQRGGDDAKGVMSLHSLHVSTHPPPVIQHDDVIKWKHFPRYWPFVRGIHRWPVNSPHKAQWRGALMFSLICLNTWLSKQSWCRWNETPSCSLWRQLNALSIYPSGGARRFWIGCWTLQMAKKGGGGETIHFGKFWRKNRGQNTTFPHVPRMFPPSTHS